MINFEKVHGQPISMIAWSKDDNGEDKVIVYAGTAEWDGKHLTIHWNHSDESYVLPDDWLQRVRPVEPELKHIMKDAKFALTVSIATLPDGEDVAALKKVGIKWPD